MFEQPFSELVLIGLVFKLVGFMMRDALWLRGLVGIGLICDIVFVYLQSPPIWGSAIANGLIVIVNLVVICIIVFERSTWLMSTQERIAFKHFETLTPGQFRRINKMAKWRVAADETVLLNEGEPTEKLFYLDIDQFTIRKQGQDYATPGPAFAGEISYLKGGVASATVIVPRTALYAEWDTGELRALMQTSRPLNNALMARFGLDMAGKVRTSVPMQQLDQTQN